jgi:hypothetical protein
MASTLQIILLVAAIQLMAAYTILPKISYSRGFSTVLAMSDAGR